MSTETRSVTLRIDSRLENVGLVGVAVRAMAALHPGLADSAAVVELAVVEAVNNAIIHAYHRQPGFQVEVLLGFGPHGVVITVADEGQPFEHFPDPLPSMPSGDDIDAMPLSGWGLRILGEVMDQVYYRSLEGRNELTMLRRARP